MKQTTSVKEEPKLTFWQTFGIIIQALFESWVWDDQAVSLERQKQTNRLLEEQNELLRKGKRNGKK